MRKSWLAAALVAVALVLQLSVLNGLRLPGGGVPDLVLVLVAALGMAEGPIAGVVIGFAAGLCLDLAPPDTQLIGQFALVFCLAGWAAGRLRGLAGRSAVRSLVLVAFVVAAAEVLSAALGLVLEPAQVTVPAVRQILPYTVGYDLLLSPFVLYLVILVGVLLPGSLAGLRTRRAEDRKRPRPHQPRLVHAAARPGDGWIGIGPTRLRGARPPARRPPRLRPAGGVPGSASGLAYRVGPGLHPGTLAGSASRFRPHGGESGGSASRNGLPGRVPGLDRVPTTIRFGGHRRDGTVGRVLGGAAHAPLRPAGAGAPRLRLTGSRSAAVRPGPGRPAPRINFHGSPSSVPRPPVRREPRLSFRGSPTAVTHRPVPREPRLNFRGSSSLVVPRPVRPAPKLHFHTEHPPVARRPAAAPKFRRNSTWLPSAPFGLVGGGVLDQSTFRAMRRQRIGTPRLRLSGGRRGSGTIGGSGGSTRLSRPPGRTAKQPRFGYGRRSLLSFLTAKHVGGHWLASKQVGSRSGVWLLGRRTGGVR